MNAVVLRKNPGLHEKVLKNQGVTLFTLLISLLFSSCSVSEDKIVGQWGQHCSPSEMAHEQLVVVHFNGDHTGKMITYSRSLGIEQAAYCEFKWEVDGYMVNLTGTSYDDENTESFSTKFRYTDGKLKSEFIIPGIFVNSPKIILIKQ